MPEKVPLGSPFTVRTSPSNPPTAILTTPETRLRLSTSLAVAPGEIVTGAPFSVYAAFASTVSRGASFTAAMLTVDVVVVAPVPSETVHVRVRCGLVPKSVGFSLVDWNPTVCSSA